MEAMESQADTLVTNSLGNGGAADGNGTNLVGRKIRKKFGRKFYNGTITGFEIDTNWFKVTYDDGDCEELEWAEVEPLLVSEEPAAKKPKRAAAASGPKSRKKRKGKSKSNEPELIDLNSSQAPEVEHGQASDGEVIEAEDNHENDEGLVDNSKEEILPVQEEYPEVQAEEPVEEYVDEEGAVQQAQIVEVQEPKPAKKRGRPAKKTATPKPKKKPAPKKQTQSVKKRKAESAPVATPSPKKAKTKTTKSAAKPKPAARSPKAETRSPKSSTKKKPATKKTAATPKGAKPTPAKGKELVVAQEPHSPHTLGRKLKGRKIRKDFDGTLYDGEIQSYDRKHKFYKIQYEDGDREDLEWREIEPLLLPFDEQEPTSAPVPATIKTTVKVLIHKHRVVTPHRPATRATSAVKSRRRRPTTPVS